MSSAGIELNNLRSRRTQPTEPPAEERLYRGLKWVMITIPLYMSCFLHGLGLTITAGMQGPVLAEFDHIDQLSWLGASYPLGSICVILILGTLYRTFDGKWVYLAMVILFLAGCGLSGGAPNMNALIAGRVLAGAGGTGIHFGSLQYIDLLTTDSERRRYMSPIAYVWVIGSLIGPLIGGAFAVSAGTWRWAFYLNLVIGGVCAPVFIFCLPSVLPEVDRTTREKLANIDLVGFVLGCGVWVSFLLAFAQGGGQWPWNDGRTITTLVVFITTLILYALQQYLAIFTTPHQRAFDAHLMLDRTQVLLSIVTAAGTSSVLVIIYYFPLYFLFVMNDGALMSTVRLLPFAAFCAGANFGSEVVLPSAKYYNVYFVMASFTVLMGGGPLVYYLEPSTPIGTIYGFSLLTGIGTGLGMMKGYTVSAMTIEPEDADAAFALLNVAHVGGQVIALAIAGQIYRTCAIKNLGLVLGERGYSYSQIREAVAGAQSTLIQELVDQDRIAWDEVTNAVVQAMRMTFILVPIAGAIMLMAALWMKCERLWGDPNPLLMR